MSALKSFWSNYLRWYWYFRRHIFRPSRPEAARKAIWWAWKQRTFFRGK